MATKTTYRVPRRRRREGITNARKRLNLLKPRQMRLVARISSRQAIAQIIKYNPKGDEVLVNTSSLELKKYNYKGNNGNASASYLTGYLCAKKALEQGINEAVLDIGLRTPVYGSNVFSVLKGAVDAGLNIPHSDTVFPKEDRLNVNDPKIKIDSGLIKNIPKGKKGE